MAMTAPSGVAPRGRRGVLAHRHGRAAAALAAVWLSLAALLPATAEAKADEFLKVTVADAYLDLHTGPGRGYPVTRSVPRGEVVEVIKRRTDWFLVRDDRQREGWVTREQLALTLLADGSPLKLDDPTRRDFEKHRWELGVSTGDFGGANVIHAAGGYLINENLSAELGVAHVLGNASNQEMVLLGLTHTFRPDWRIAPFATIGTGMIHVTPKSTLVATVDRTDQLAYVGVGVKGYLSRRFVLRADYRSYVVFTDRDDNQEVNEWTVGFAFFF